MTLDDWWSGGVRIGLPIDSHASRPPPQVFCRVEGSGPWLTLLHGFPTCSWDWAPIWPLLVPHFRVLTLDYLGYGDSDKPADIAYCTALHADTIAAAWRHFSVHETFVVGHDVGTAVAQELLARRAEGAPGPALRSALLMNGAIITDRYRPRVIQRLLTNPLTGPLLARTTSERTFARSLRRAFCVRSAIPDSACAAYWRAMTRRGGNRRMHRLMHYIAERARYKARWEAALTQGSTPLRFVWGMADPFTGVRIAEDIRRRVRSADLVELEGVGHFPQLERPLAVAEQILRWVDAAPRLTGTSA